MNLTKNSPSTYQEVKWKKAQKKSRERQKGAWWKYFLFTCNYLKNIETAEIWYIHSSTSSHQKSQATQLQLLTALAFSQVTHHTTPPLHNTVLPCHTDRGQHKRLLNCTQAGRLRLRHLHRVSKESTTSKAKHQSWISNSKNTQNEARSANKIMCC